jgi:hypothetical protein
VFCLTINLWVVSGGGHELYTDKVPQLPGEFRYELQPAVRNNVLPGSSVVLPDVPVVKSSGSDSPEASVAPNEAGLPTEDVNHDHDHIKPMHVWEFHDEVHQNRVPVLLWNLSQVKLTMGQLLERLCPVARVAGSDILTNVSGKLGPPVAPGDKLQHLEVASMSGNPHVVVLLHDPTIEVLIPWHDYLATKQEEPV